MAGSTTVVADVPLGWLCDGVERYIGFQVTCVSENNAVGGVWIDVNPNRFAMESPGLDGGEVVK